MEAISSPSRPQVLFDLEEENLEENESREKQPFQMPPQQDGRNNEGNQDRADPPDIESQVYLAVVYQKPKLGVAFYDAVSGHFSVVEKYEDSDFSMLQLVKYETNPKEIITSAKSDVRFLEAVPLRLFDDDALPYPTKTLKSSEFSLELCRARVLRLELPGMPKGMSLYDKEAYLARDIDFESHQMVRAAGALIGHLQNNGITNALDEANKPFQITEINNWTLAKTLHVDIGTMNALQIFKTDAHPSAHGIGRSKEGLSLFGLLDNTKSVPGKRLLKKWLMRPPLDSSLITERLDAVAFLVDSAQQQLVAELLTYIKKARDLTGIVSRLQNRQYTVKDIQSVQETLTACLLTMHAIRDLQVCEIRVIHRLSALDGPALEELVSIINGTVDFAESRAENRVIPKDGVLQQLDEQRMLYDGLDDLLTKIGVEEMQRYPSIQSMQMIYYPQIGFLIVVSADPNVDIERQKMRNSTLEYQFHTDQAFYFKNPRCYELDEQLGDIYNVIVELEQTIVQELEQLLIDRAPLLMEVTNSLAELDCLISLATAAKLYRLTRPIITQDNELIISKGRHPLQELTVETFIPNNTAMVPMRDGMVKIITGPNGSGKSVYLKQVGLIAYMAHIGSFVPAESAKIGLIDRIFSRITSRESVSVAQSTFLLDLNQIAAMLQHSTDRSLLLVDEFGKGTEAQDGLCLAASFVRYLLNRKEACPKTLFATHFIEIIEQNLIDRNSPNLELLQLDVHVEADKDRAFLYRLSKGYNPYSYATTCARQVGIPPEITARAEAVATAHGRGEPITALVRGNTKKKLYRDIVKQFLALDVERDDLVQWLRATLNRIPVEE